MRHRNIAVCRETFHSDTSILCAILDALYSGDGGHNPFRDYREQRTDDGDPVDRIANEGG